MLHDNLNESAGDVVLEAIATYLHGKTRAGIGRGLAVYGEIVDTDYFLMDKPVNIFDSFRALMAVFNVGSHRAATQEVDFEVGPIEVLEWDVKSP